VTNSPKANDGAQNESYNSKGSFEHIHPPHPLEGHTIRLNDTYTRIRAGSTPCSSPEKIGGTESTATSPAEDYAEIRRQRQRCRGCFQERNY
jgi:hypothetical protein